VSEGQNAEKVLPLTEWVADAERDADATRAPSGYYPSARILRLIEELTRVTAPEVIA
jgi:hypothetical protein